MKQITTSPSELLTWNDCARKWYFKYDRRLQLKAQNITPPMASGIAVHYVIETLTRDFPKTIPDAADVRLRAEDSLLDTFADHPDREAMTKKFKPGVLRALSKVPEEIWLSDWIVETDVQGTFTTEDGELEVTLKGRPDMYRQVSPGHIEIVDPKTTATEPLSYMLWNPQLRWYAAVLSQQYPNYYFTYRYLCLPTQGDKPAPQSPPWPFTKRQLGAAVADLLQKARDYNPDINKSRESRACDFCDFKQICMTIIGGGDPSGIAKELYETRTRRA